MIRSRHEVAQVSWNWHVSLWSYARFTSKVVSTKVVSVFAMADDTEQIFAMVRALPLAATAKRRSVISKAALRLACSLPFLSEKRRNKHRRSLYKAMVADLRDVTGGDNEKPIGNTPGMHAVETLPPVGEAPEIEPSLELSPLIQVGLRSIFREPNSGAEWFATNLGEPIDVSCAVPTPVRRSFLAMPSEYHKSTDRSLWLAENEENAARLLISAMKNMDVLSLDVFDTFILRGNEAEAERYHLFSRFLLDRLTEDTELDPLRSVTAEALTLMRARAMQLTYQTRPQREGCGEGSIIEVAASLSRTLAGNASLTERLLELEVAFEIGMMKPNPLLSRIVKRFRENGGTVVLISDMYLHSDQIRKIIEGLDPGGLASVDYIFSSADTIVSKRSGKLFRHVEATLGLNPKSTLHIGDSFVSDVQQARRAGWNALYFPVSRGEMALRQASLKRVIEHFDELSIDIRDWAKV